MSLKRVTPGEAVKRIAAKLEKDGVAKEPDWLAGVKTGSVRERLPAKGFWPGRCAAVLRTIHLNGPVGVERLRNKFGGKKRHVVSSPHHGKGAGKMIRTALQQLESAGLVEKKARGRVVTAKGMKFVDQALKG
jgi:small subunit ribosomal protein S19e